jgi:hypothetical protein
MTEHIIVYMWTFNPLNAKLNPIHHLLALLGAHHILHVSRIRVNCGMEFALVIMEAI